MKNNDCTNTNCSLYGKCNLGDNCYLYKGKKKSNKYQAKKCEYDGEVFDSIKERDRYAELKLLERAGEISNLRRQVKFVLIPEQREPNKIGKRGATIKGDLLERELSYVADFCYVDKDSKEITEDVKGYKGGGAYAIFKIKKKLMLYIHGIKVKEI